MNDFYNILLVSIHNTILIYTVLQYVHHDFQVIQSQVCLPLKFHPAHPEYNLSINNSFTSRAFPGGITNKRIEQQKLN